MATKPPARPSTPSAPAAKAEAAVVVVPPKSHKLLIIVVVLLVLIIAGGAGWYFTRSHAPDASHVAEAKVEPVMEAKFIPLGEKFTVNLQREEGDQYLQAGIMLKILDPMLEEKIKLNMPELRSKLLFLLSSKKPSELVSIEGKQELVQQIIAMTNTTLGVNAAAAHSDKHGVAAASAVTAAAPVIAAGPNKAGVVDVLFTDFIIQ